MLEKLNSLSFLPQSFFTWALIVVVGVLYGYYKFTTWHFDVFKRLGIKGPTPLPLLGTMWPMIKKGLIHHDLELKKYGSVVGTFQGSIPMLMIYDLEIIKQILIKDFSNFTNRFDPGFSNYPLDKMLLVLKDDHWKHVRNHLTPTFTAGKLRKMDGKMHRCLDALLSTLEKKADAKETFEFRQLCGAFTMDVIASTAFGVEVDSLNDVNNVFVKMAKKAFDFSFSNVTTLILFFAPFLVKPLSKVGISIFPRDATEFFGKVVDKAMADRKKGNEDDVDFLQLMTNAQVGGEDFEKSTWSTKGLTHQEILAQGILFFFAGYETTANTLSLLGYQLALNPECQEKLIKEVDEAMADKKHVTYDIAQNMSYLDMCINETLRMYPAGPRTDRVAKTDITINGVFIPKGMIIGIPIYAFQNDPEIWPEPEKFNPERFTEDAKESRDPISFMPFGSGPRNCVGMRLALMELKMSMVHILQRMKFVVSEETQIPLKLDKLKMQGVNGIRIKVERRVKDETSTGPTTCNGTHL